MTDKPELKWMACHRDKQAVELAKRLSKRANGYRRIGCGSLAGCYHDPKGRSVYQVNTIGPSCVLEFCLVIRVRL